MTVRVQSEDFDLGHELDAMTRGNTGIGGLCSFVGLVRDMNDGAGVGGMVLEHYPGMTEKMLEEIEAQAHERWPLQASLIIHRYGPLQPGDRIVLVAAASPHRDAAVSGLQFPDRLAEDKSPLLESGTIGQWRNPMGRGPRGR